MIPNVYDDEARARSYADLEFPGTYYLAFRDLPDIIDAHAAGKRALDFGCGAGRSTRFLTKLGFDTVGVDVSEPMVTRAKTRDPGGEYLIVEEGDLTRLGDRRFDVVLCSFTFDNVATHLRLPLFSQLRDLLAPRGCIVNLVSAEEIYVNEWLSFSTKDFPENRIARTGDTVRIVMLDVPDRRPVEDVFWSHADYAALFSNVGLSLIETHRPLGQPTDPYPWVTERTVSPWAIHILCRSAMSSS